MDIAKLIDAIGHLAWPVLVAIVLWRLFPLVKDVARSRPFTIKVGELELSVQDASEKLRIQIEDLQKKVTELRTNAPVTMSPPVVQGALTEMMQRPTAHIVWLDDNPDGNAYELARLRDAGVDVSEARSTSEALRQLVPSAKVDAILTDMGRREDGAYKSKAGLDFIQQVRELGIQTPIFVYTAQRSAAHLRDVVLASGASGITGSPVELFEFLGQVLKTTL
jgi:CheY-like chemotaxis protein